MKSLFDQTSIGSMHLKNRFIRSATGENFIKGERPTEEMLEFYENLATSGVGTIITGCTRVIKSGTEALDMMSIYDEYL
jgi:2,4-dienoyl-CoA reductase-like NADH-dependent reductase (Old Yellow Enzyme family)